MSGRRDGKQPVRGLHQSLKRAVQFVNQGFVNGTGGAGVTQRQLALLAAVERNDGASQTVICQMTGMDRSTLAELVARMMELGHVQRRRDKEDGRANTVRITPTGRKLLKTAAPGAEESERQVLAKLPPPLRKPFLEAVDLLAQEMDRIEAEPRKESRRKGRIRRRA